MGNSLHNKIYLGRRMARFNATWIRVIGCLGVVGWLLSRTFK